MDMNQFSPNLLSYPEPPEFDYAAFLQGDDVSFTDQQFGAAHALGHSSDSSGKATTPSSDNVSSTGAADAVARRPTAQQQQRQRLERRGHTKSRRGCYNCKRRRIKCQENHPACGHCVKTGLKCEYPSLPQITHQPHSQIPLFSLQDMRFFQHFLTQCYPHHPLKQEDIWTHEIPCIAHNHDFLMHAILGFAASELIPTDNSLVSAAMNHRVKAIRAIKKRLTETSRGNTSYEEANALIATCFALTFQSVSLDDGLAEYMTFIRGIVIVTMQMMFRGIKPIFNNLNEDDQDATLAPFMEGLPLIERSWADAATEAITNLRPLCVETVEVEYAEKLLEVTKKLYVNSFDAYKANAAQYGWWMMMSHASFQEVINMDNQLMMLLHAHWIALSQIMTFISAQEYEVRVKQPQLTEKETTIDPGFLRWLKYINARVDYEHQIYNQWPMWVEEMLDKDISFFGKRR